MLCPRWFSVTNHGRFPCVLSPPQHLRGEKRPKACALPITTGNSPQFSAIYLGHSRYQTERRANNLFQTDFQVVEAEAFSFCRVFQENPELTGNIMEINDLREFGRLVFVTRLLPQENAKNTKTRGYVNCFVFFCDLCALSRPSIFGRRLPSCSP
jgi:hypothetical protein